MTTDQLEYWRLQNEISRTKETERANRAKENLTQQEIYETLRHNMTDEQIRQSLASLEKSKFDLSKWKAENENTRDWIDAGMKWFYTVFSQMPLDATKGFANWGQGMRGVAAIAGGS